MFKTGRFDRTKDFRTKRFKGLELGLTEVELYKARFDRIRPRIQYSSVGSL